MKKQNTIPLDRLETQAIDFLRTIARQVTSPLFLAYSGGKDSEIVLHLARKAKIEFVPFYNNTTIDPPGTLKYIQSKGDIMIIPPAHSFFYLIEHRGLPSTFQRFCCEKLKERFVATNVITGVRRAESIRRAKRYTEPEMCMKYKHGQRGYNYMPILYWLESDVEKYIVENNIRCHPNYYNGDGTFNVKYRLGCMGCPLAGDRGRKDFLKWPRLVKAWTRALAVYRNTRPRLQKSITDFDDEYENFWHNLHNRKLEDLEREREFPWYDPREYLQGEFGIELPPASSTLTEIRKKFNN